MGERSAELAEIIISEISDGTPLRQICRDHDIGKSTVYDWLKEDEEFAGRFARARDIGFDAIADTCLEIADDCEEEPASRRVRVETRLKLLAKWAPKKYGEKLDLNHSGSVDVITKEQKDASVAAALGTPR